MLESETWTIPTTTLFTGVREILKNELPRWRKSARITTDGKVMLNQDFNEFLQSLNNNSVRYLVIDGYAVAFHGHPRYTKDIDVWIEISLENSQRLVKALNDFGLGSLNLTADQFQQPRKVFQFGHPPRRIDILTSPVGIEFDDCYQRRIDQTIDGILMPFISLEDLRVAKKAAGRLQDLADLENLA